MAWPPLFGWVLTRSLVRGVCVAWAPLFGWVLTLAALAIDRPVHADMPRNTPAAIEVDRDAAPGGRVGFGFDGGEPVDAWGASLTLGWLDRPIALPAGAFGASSPATRPVRRRETLALGGALAVGDSLVLDAVLRASHQVGDRLVAAGDPAHLARYVLHDLRLGGRIRVVGDADRAALLRAELTLPSGNDAAFAGDASWTAVWSLIGRITLPRRIVIAGDAGIRLFGAEVAIGNRLVGDALFAAAGAAVPLPALGLDAADHMSLTAELLGALGDRVGKAGPSPLEARFGAVMRSPPALAAGVHLGVGLDDQIGAPRFRVVLELAWTPHVDRPAAAPVTAPPPPDDDEPDEP